MGVVLLLLALVAPCALAWLMVQWLSRKEKAGQQNKGRGPGQSGSRP